MERNKHTSENLDGALKQREDMYDTKVLVGNWFENRFSDKTDRHAITPCIYGESTCVLGDSTYSTNYTPQVLPNFKEGINEFIAVKHTAFENRMRSNETNVKLFDGEPFMRNMTTVNDALYRLKPQEAKKAGEFNLLRQRVKDDLLRGYGNQTNTGLLQWKRCDNQRELQRRTDMTTYKEGYIPKPIAPQLHGKKKC